MTDTADDVVVHIATGITAAWWDMHHTVRSIDYTHDRTTGSRPIHPPRRDPDTLTAYTRAQTAITLAYDTAIAAGAQPFWPAARHTNPAQPRTLQHVTLNLRPHLHHPDIATQLAAAAEALARWWRHAPPRTTRICRICRERPTPPRRRLCWACAKRQYRRRQRTRTTP
jgi:hypothetical protein